MKKLILLVLIVLFAVSGKAQQKKVAFIAKAGVTADYEVDNKPILDLLRASYNVTTLLSTDAGSSSDYDAYDLVVLSETASSGDARNISLKGINKPILNLKVHVYGISTSKWSWTSSVGQDNSLLSLTVVDKTHPIFKTPNAVTISSTDNTVAMFSQLGTNTGGTALGLGYADPATFAGVAAGQVKILANCGGLDTKTCVLEVMKGANLGGGDILQKFIQVGLSAVSFNYLTADAKKIVQNACDYLLSPSTGITAPDMSEQWKIFVNTNKEIDFRSFSGNANDLTVDVFDIKGALVFKSKVKMANQATIDLSQLKAGAYTFSAYNKDGFVKKSFIISK